MNNATKETIREIADHGLWTMGLVASIAIGVAGVRDLGPIGAVAPVVAIVVLGVTGYWAVDSVDQMMTENGGNADR